MTLVSASGFAVLLQAAAAAATPHQRSPSRPPACLLHHTTAGYRESLGEELLYSAFDAYLEQRGLSPARVTVDDAAVSDFLDWLMTAQRGGGGGYDADDGDAVGGGAGDVDGDDVEAGGRLRRHARPESGEPDPDHASDSPAYSYSGSSDDEGGDGDEDCRLGSGGGGIGVDGDDVVVVDGSDEEMDAEGGEGVMGDSGGSG